MNISPARITSSVDTFVYSDLILRLLEIPDEETPCLQRLRVAPLSSEVNTSEVNSSKAKLRAIQELVRSLIFDQFPERYGYGLLELVSNSMDANVKNQTPEASIDIEVSDRLVLTDRGQGMAEKDLKRYMEANFASNRESSKQGLIGRFGQGHFAGFSFLFCSSVEDQFELPRIMVDSAQRPTISLLVLENEIPYQITFTDDPTGLKTKRKALSVKSVTPRFTLRTHQQGHTPLKICFFPVAHELWVSISRAKETCPLGTKITMHSPLILMLKPYLERIIRRTYFFSQTSPVTVNATEINLPSNYHRKEFAGCTLYYSKEPSTRQGSLFIAEQGRLVAELRNLFCLVPPFVCIDFAHLPLTKDRSRVDYKDPQTQEIIKGMLSLLLQQEASFEIINSFYQLLRPERFDLIDWLKVQLSNSSCCPDVEDLASAQIEGMLYVHPSYLSAVNTDKSKVLQGCILHIVQMKSACVTWDDGVRHHVFMNERLINHPDRNLVNFNLYLLLEIAKLQMSKRQESLMASLEEIKMHLAATRYSTPSGKSDSDHMHSLLQFFTRFSLTEDASTQGKPIAEALVQLFQELVQKFPNDRDALASLFRSQEALLIQYASHRLLLPIFTTYLQHAWHSFGFLAEFLKDFNTLPENAKDRFVLCLTHECQDSDSNMSLANYPGFKEIFTTIEAIISHLPNASVNMVNQFLGSFTKNQLRPLLQLIQTASSAEMKTRLLTLANELNDLEFLCSLQTEQVSQIAHVAYGLERMLSETDYVLLVRQVLTLKLSISQKGTIVKFYYALSDAFYRPPFLWAPPTFAQEEAFLRLVIEYIREEDCIEQLVELMEHFDSTEEQRTHASQLIEGEETTADPEVKRTVDELTTFLRPGLPLSESRLRYRNSLVFTLLEQCKACCDELAPYIHLALFGDNVEFKSTNYTPILVSESRPQLLIEDRDVLQSIGSASLAQKRLEQHLNPSFESELDWLRELIDLAEATAASYISIDFHLNCEKQFVALVSMDGAGLPFEALKQRVIPGSSETFFSLLHTARSCQVTSCHRGSQSRLSLDRRGCTLLFLQNGPVNSFAPSGLEFALTCPSCSHPSYTFIHLKSAISSLCRQKQNLQIFINDQQINKPASSVELETKVGLFKLGAHLGDLLVQVRPETTGLFYNELKKESTIPERYFALVPKSILEKSQGVPLAIFFPKSLKRLQVGQLYSEREYLLRIQFALFRTLLLHYVRQWTKLDLLELLSDDYWNDFRHLRTNSANATLLAALQTGDIAQFLKDFDSDKFNHHKLDHFVEEVTHYFSQAKNATLIAPKCETQDKIQEFLRRIRTKTVEEVLQSRLLQLSSFQNQQELVSLLVALPLIDHGPSFLEIRGQILAALQTEGIIDAQGKYNFPKIASVEPAKAIIQAIASRHPAELHKLIFHFQKQVVASLEAIIEKKKLKLPTRSPKPLTLFLQKLAQDALKCPIDIVYYAEADGWNAYVMQGSTTMHINLLTPEVQQFLEKVAGKPARFLDLLLNNHSDLLVFWATKLAHECTHMKENSGCASTHDTVFKTNMITLLEQLAIYPESSPHVCTALLEILFSQASP